MSTELDLSEEDGGSVRDEAGRKVPGDLSSQPLLDHLSHPGCDFLLGMACGSVATWGRCQSSWVNDARGRLALGQVGDEPPTMSAQRGADVQGCPSRAPYCPTRRSPERPGEDSARAGVRWRTLSSSEEAPSLLS